MEYLEDYGVTLHYYPGNVVANALSRKSRGVLANVSSRKWQMLETMGQLGYTTGVRLRVLWRV